MRKQSRLHCIVAVLIAANAGFLAAQESNIEKDPRVKAKIALSLDQIEAGQNVRIWIVVENGLDSEITDVAFDEFETPGFTRVKCWQNGAPACQGNSEEPQPIRSIKAHDIVVLWATLTRSPDLSNGQKILLASSFHWTEGANATPPAPVVRRTFVSTPAELKAPSWTLLQIFKDYTLPVMAVALPFLFYFYQQKRSETTAIWTEMLEKVTKDTEAHYIPIGRAARDFARDASEAKQATSAATSVSYEKALYRMLSLNAIVRDFHAKKGGWYFKSITGETVVSLAWNLYKKSEARALNHEDIEKVVGWIRPNEFYDSCRPTIDFIAQNQSSSPSSGAHNSILQLFKDWSTSQGFEVAKLCLNVMTNVIAYEINRPFQRWYDTPLPKNTADCEGFIGRCEALMNPAPGQTGPKDLEPLLKALREHVDYLHGS